MKICLRCDEPILSNEVLPVADGELHRECLIRGFVGSVAHQQRKCSCYGGTGEDDRNLTVRENAKAAADYFQKMQQKIVAAKFN